MYEPDADFYGADEITVEVDDGGFSGIGGPLTASGTVEVSIVRR